MGHLLIEQIAYLVFLIKFKEQKRFSDEHAFHILQNEFSLCVMLSSKHFYKRHFVSNSSEIFRISFSSNNQLNVRSKCSYFRKLQCEGIGWGISR